MKNRQGKPWGTGTTSNARRERRAHLQPQVPNPTPSNRGPGDGRDPPSNRGPGGDRGPPSNRDAPTTTAPRNRAVSPSNRDDWERDASWERGWSYQHGWYYPPRNRGDDWWEGRWNRDEWHEGPWERDAGWWEWTWRRRSPSNRGGSPSNRVRKWERMADTSSSEEPIRLRERERPQDGAVIQEPAAEVAATELGPSSSHDTCKQLEKAEKKEAEKTEESDSYTYESSSEDTQKIGVDWHNVVEIEDCIVENSLDALARLEKAGWDITIISYAGPQRGREVLKKISKLGSVSRNWGRHITPQRVGKGGKAELCLEKGIQYMMDDSAQILQDCQKKGIKILPIMTKFESHGWHEGKNFKSCQEAVEHLLSKEP